jgi:hypothetical protein
LRVQATALGGVITLVLGCSSAGTSPDGQADPRFQDLLDGGDAPVVDEAEVAAWRAATGHQRDVALARIHEELAANGVLEAREDEVTWRVRPMRAPEALPEDLFAALAGLDTAGGRFDSARHDPDTLGETLASHPFADGSGAARRRLGDLLVEAGRLDEGGAFLDAAVVWGVAEARAERDQVRELRDRAHSVLPAREVSFDQESVWATEETRTVWERHWPAGFSARRIVFERPGLVVFEGVYRAPPEPRPPGGKRRGRRRRAAEVPTRVAYLAVDERGGVRWKTPISVGDGEPLTHQHVDEIDALIVAGPSRTVAIGVEAGDVLWSRIRSQVMLGSSPEIRIEGDSLLVGEPGRFERLDPMSGRARSGDGERAPRGCSRSPH